MPGKRMSPGVIGVAVMVVVLTLLGSDRVAGEPYCEQVEADWLRQAAGLSEPGSGVSVRPSNVPTWADAAGAVDGVEHGKYAFHTGHEPNPWWQVDLGELVSIARIVVYNRLDYAPGLHNADTMLILASDDGKAWRKIHDNQGKHFGGISGAPPLEVTFPAGKLRARFVRLQIPSRKPVWFHLDEVEIYGPEDSKRNLALRKPADQSSVSQWSTAKAQATPPCGVSDTAAFPVRKVIERAWLLAADLATKGVDVRPFERELDEVGSAFQKLPDDTPAEAARDLYLAARRTVRRLVFANPLLDFDRIVLVKRFTQDTYPDVCLNHMPWVSRPGGDICVVTLGGPAVEPQVRPLIDGRLGPGHVHGMDLWFDADRAVFGYAKKKTPEGPVNRSRANNHELRRTVEPTHLFEINLDGTGLRQLTDSRDWSDLDPTYLPSGNVAFVSERCGCSLQCNEFDKDETSCNIYVMRPDGSSIRRLSNTKDGDYLPHCLADGTIGYTRWEYQERRWATIQSLWFVRPDGTGADALFKQHLDNPWALEDVRSVPGTANSRLVCIATGHHTLATGPVVIVTPSHGMNDPRAIRIVTPDVRPPEGGMSGTPVDEGGVRDAGGLYMTPWPLSENYFLVSYTYSNEQTDATGYAIYLIDVFGNKELIYRDPAISCFVPIPLKPRPKPPILPDVTDPAKDYAVCSLADATFGVPGIAPDRAKYLRISQRVLWPYDNTYGGQRYEPDVKHGAANWTPARVIGTVKLKPDGSAHFRVPVDTPVYFQLLDENKQELRRMRSFISFQPGEQRACVGCHETRGTAPPDGKFSLALLKNPVEPSPPPWGTRPMNFLSDVQPIFDRHCTGCHTGLKPAGGLDFSGGLTFHHQRQRNVAYDTLLDHNLVSRSDVRHDDSRITQPLEFGSHRSRLVAVLREGACSTRAKLDDQEWLRLITWIDLNGPYHGGFINKRDETPSYDPAADTELVGRLTEVHARRCAACHKPEEVTRVGWLDLHQPEESLFLAAPLSKSAGGLGRCEETVYADRQDADYQAVHGLVRGAVQRAWKQPRRDVRELIRKDTRMRQSIRSGKGQQTQ